MCPYHVCWRRVCSILYYTKQTFQDRFQGVWAIRNRWSFWGYDRTKSLELFQRALESWLLLRILEVASCPITGTFPDNIGQLMGLTALEFRFTRISAAPIPSSVRNLQSLRKLDLGRNSITFISFEPGSSQFISNSWVYSCRIQLCQEIVVFCGFSHNVVHQYGRSLRVNVFVNDCAVYDGKDGAL